MRLAMTTPDTEVDRAEGAQEQAIKAVEELVPDEELASGGVYIGLAIPEGEMPMRVE